MTTIIIVILLTMLFFLELKVKDIILLLLFHYNKITAYFMFEFIRTFELNPCILYF